MSRLEDAVQIRDAAVKKLQEEGEFEKVENSGPVLGWKSRDRKDGGIHMVLRTPFQKLPKHSSKFIKDCIKHGIKPTENLSNGLDIWAGPKVLNIEWDHKGQVILVSFKRGSWEKIILSE
jgi:hypothetical protein